MYHQLDTFSNTFRQVSIPKGYSGKIETWRDMGMGVKGLSIIGETLIDCEFRGNLGKVK